MAEPILTAKELGVRSLPPGSPSHLEHILDELNQSLDLDAPGTSLRVLKKAFVFLSAYFADLVEGVASSLGCGIRFTPKPGDTSEALETIREGIEFLHAAAPKRLLEVRALVDCFYDGGSGREFARLLTIGGKPRRATVALESFLAALVPSRKKCVQEIRHYIPYLREWLEVSASLFQQAAIVSERTSLGGRQVIIVKLGTQTIRVGKRIQVSSCPLCIPVKAVEVPEGLYERPLYFFVPQKSPRPLAAILDRLDRAMQGRSAVAGCLELRNALEFLIRYFAGVTSKLCEELGALPKTAEPYIDASQSISSSEKLLSLCLDALKRVPDSLAAQAVVGVFYRRNELFEFVPRWHTEMLALNGQLSAWCQLEPGQGELRDRQACKIEFEKHALTLHDWLVSLGPYLQSTEHFFNSPKREGFVEFSLRIGHQFVEVGEPGYVLWLSNPRPEETVHVDPGGPAKPLIREPIAIPSGCPCVLSRILSRMDIFLRLGDPVESCVSLQDSLDYLTRYFAGLAAAAMRELGTLPPEAERLARQSLSIHDCEKLLILALSSIGRESDGKLGYAVRSVFYYGDDFSDSEKPTGAHSRLLALDADPSSKMQNLAEFCSLNIGKGVLADPVRSNRELERFLPTLQDWLAMAGPFFKKTVHHEEPPEEDGKTELIIEYEEFYLELVEPDYVFYIRPGADLVPDIEAPELPPLELTLEDSLFDGESPGGRKTGDLAAPEHPFLVHRVDLIGSRPNSKGKKCAAGYIRLTNAGGGTLSGNATSTDDSVEVEPARFRGNKVQLSYWVDSDQLPTTHEVYILLKTAHEERSISIYEMVGQAGARSVSKASGSFRMLLPVGFWLLLLTGVFHGISTFMDGVLTDKIGPDYQGLRLIQDAPDTYSAVIFFAQLVGYLYLLVGGLVPVQVARAYRSLPPSTQELLEKQRPWIMILPSMLVGVAMFTPLLRNYFSSAPDFPAMSFYGMYLYFLGLNLASIYYQEMSLSERIDDMFSTLTSRKAVTIVAWFLFLTTVMLGVSM